jgi:uncharacterized membrane protein HdeD (DUF308 family)
VDGTPSGFAAIFARGWWAVLLRGLLAVAFAALVQLLPDISLETLVSLFATLALADGALVAWTAIAGHREHDDWWVPLLGGVLGIGIGVVTLTAPHITGLLLLLYVAIWAITKGIIEIAVAVRLPREIVGEWALIQGPVSIGFGALLIARPSTGALARLGVIGTYCVTFGVILATLSWKARALGRRVAREGAPAAAGAAPAPRGGADQPMPGPTPRPAPREQLHV